MADLLEQASDWLGNQRTSHRTHTVTYVRHEDTVDVPATIGPTPFEIDNGYGVIERTESRDFLVLTEELVLAGNHTLPERGDRIRDTRGTTTYVYEVMAPGKEPHWRYSDPYRKTLRIHSKQIATENS